MLKSSALNVEVSVNMLKFRDTAVYIGCGFFALSIGFFYGSYLTTTSKIKSERNYFNNRIEIVESVEPGNKGLEIGAGLCALAGIGFCTAGLVRRRA